MKSLKKHIQDGFLILLLPIICYFYLAYFFERGSFNELLYMLPILFASYAYVLYNLERFQWKYLFAIGLLIRLVFLFSLPALSDDLYRFIWDGLLVKGFEDPYAMLPSEFNTVSEFQALLRSKMNSPNYYSVYPPFLQYIFGFTAWIGSDSLLANVLVLHLLVIAAEVGTFFLLRIILKKLKLSRDRAFIYFLNPLVIIELSGNLHPEAFWILFFLFAIYLMIEQKWLISGAAFTLGVLTKLVPLLLAPILLRKLSFLQLIRFILAGIVLAVMISAPLIDLNTILHIGDSIDLYFRSFEFNASVYYFFRWLGFQYYDYNPIQTLGPLLSLLSTVLILFILLKKGATDWQALFKRMLLALTVYYFLALVIHPWYLTPIMALACFRSYFFPILWSGLIFLSYHRYAEGVENENLAYLLLEYLPVYSLFLLEVLRKESIPFPGLKRKVFKFTVQT